MSKPIDYMRRVENVVALKKEWCPNCEEVVCGGQDFHACKFDTRRIRLPLMDAEGHFPSEPCLKSDAENCPHMKEK